MNKLTLRLVLGAALATAACGALAADRHGRDDDNQRRGADVRVHIDTGFDTRGRGYDRRRDHNRHWRADRRHQHHYRHDRRVRHIDAGRHHWRGGPARFDAGCRTVTVIRRDRRGRPYEEYRSVCSERHYAGGRGHR